MKSTLSSPSCFWSVLERTQDGKLGLCFITALEGTSNSLSGLLSFSVFYLPGCWLVDLPGIEPRSSHMLGKCYSTELQPQLLTCLLKAVHKNKSKCCFPWLFQNQKKPESDDDMEIKKQLSKYESQLSANEEKADTDERKCPLVNQAHSFKNLSENSLEWVCTVCWAVMWEDLGINSSILYLSDSYCSQSQ